MPTMTPTFNMSVEDSVARQGSSREMIYEGGIYQSNY